MGHKYSPNEVTKLNSYKIARWMVARARRSSDKQPKEKALPVGSTVVISEQKLIHQKGKCFACNDMIFSIRLQFCRLYTSLQAREIQNNSPKCAI